MASEVKMPQLSDTMSEGTILSWTKNVGDYVERGDALAEVATDKADLEIESFFEGTLIKILAEEGAKVSVGEVIAYVGEEGEEVTSSQDSSSTAEAKEDKAETPQNETPQNVVQQAHSPDTSKQKEAVSQESTSDRVKISPLAKRIAKEKGVDYSSIKGSGEGGRIVKRDIEQAAGSTETHQVSQTPQPSKQFVEPPKPRPSTEITASNNDVIKPLTSMRNAIANSMVTSVTTIPHFFSTTKVVVDEMIKVRSTLKTLPDYEGVTFNHFIMKAAAIALKKYPRINSAYSDQGIVEKGNVNLGIVTALDDGLLIPVVKRCESLSLSDLTFEAREVVQRARAGKPKADDLSGASFSISNMGKFEVDSFNAIINPGQGAILAVAPIREEPIVTEGGIDIGSTMNLTLSVDHRIIDGVLCGQFLTEIKKLLENPALLLA